MTCRRSRVRRTPHPRRQVRRPSIIASPDRRSSAWAAVGRRAPGTRSAPLTAARWGRALALRCGRWVPSPRTPIPAMACGASCRARRWSAVCPSRRAAALARDWAAAVRAASVSRRASWAPPAAAMQTAARASVASPPAAVNSPAVAPPAATAAPPAPATPRARRSIRARSASVSPGRTSARAAVSRALPSPVRPSAWTVRT